MQIGSLVTPKRDLQGTWQTNNGIQKLQRSLVKGEILTISSIDEGIYEGISITGLSFHELENKYHPDSGKLLLWWDKLFDELQPPIDISEELFSHAPEKCEV